jgi:hypothetical protein
MSDEKHKVILEQSEAIAIARLLWDIGSQETTKHDIKVMAMHWACVLESSAGMPPWPSAGIGNAECIAFYKKIVGFLEGQIDAINKADDSV